MRTLAYSLLAIRCSRRNPQGAAMKVFMFHLMPYAHLDMGYKDNAPPGWCCRIATSTR
jgi:hypothetical protein